MKEIAYIAALLILVASAAAEINFRSDQQIDFYNNISVKDNEIRDFFDQACGEDQAVKDVYDNGSFVCAPAGGLDTAVEVNNTLVRNINANGYTIINLPDASTVPPDSAARIKDVLRRDGDSMLGNIDMNGNNITDINTLKFESGSTNNGSINTSGGNIDLGNGSIIDVYSIDGGGDEINIFDPIDMNGNQIRDSEGDLEIEGNVYLPSGNLDMAGNDIINPGNVDGVDLDNPGNAIIISNSSLRIPENSIENSEINNNDQYTINGLRTKGNINLTGKNITNINALFFTSGMKINGSINTSGGDLNLDDGDINDVRSIDGGNDPVKFDNGIDLQGNNLIEPNEIQTSGQNIQIRDTANSQDIARFKQGGNLEVPNGRLTTQDIEVTDPYSGIVGKGNFRLRYSNSDATKLIIRDRFNGVDTLIAEADNDVAIPNGNLDLKVEGQDDGNNIRNTDKIIGRDSLTLEGQGSSQGINIQQGDSTTIIQAGVGDTNVRIPNGQLEMAGNRISNADDIVFEDVGGNGRNWVIEEKPGNSLAIRSNSQNMLTVTESGQLNIKSQNIDLEGNSIIDSTSSNTVRIGDGTDDQVAIDAPGNLKLENGNLDMNSKSIENYYASNCNDGETIADINNDGSFQCIDVTNEVSDIYVNRSGDTMTGNLDMQGNQIQDIGKQGIGTASPQENLDVDGTASVQSSGTEMKIDSQGNMVVTLG